MGLFGGTSYDTEHETGENTEEKGLPEVKDKTKISSSITFEGKIYGDGVIEIEGTVIGEIKSLGTVNIEEGGKVTGPVSAKNLNVAGMIEGDVIALNHIILDPTGSINGDITTSSLEIMAGGVFNGKSTMIEGDATQSEKSDKPEGTSVDISKETDKPDENVDRAD